jgi:hypothetical protein
MTQQQQQHPITPPDELVQQWEEDWHHSKVKHIELEPYIAAQAAQWSADQELEACCEWLKLEGHEYEHEALLAARRPKPQSLKEQALEALASAPGPDYPIVMTMLNADQHALIRRALEQLPDNN